MVQFLSRYYSGGLSWTGKKEQKPTVTGLKMKQRCMKELSVGENSPIPLKPTLARTVSAKRRNQWLARPRTPQKTTPVLSSLWSSGKSRQGVWSRAAELTDDSDVEEVEELESCVMPYDQSSCSTGENSSDWLPSCAPLEAYCRSSDTKQEGCFDHPASVFSGKPVSVRSPPLRTIKVFNQPQARNGSTRKTPSAESKIVMGNSKSAFRPSDSATVASHNVSRIGVVGKGIIPSTNSPVAKLSSVSPELSRRKDAWNNISSLKPALSGVYPNIDNREATLRQNSKNNSVSPDYEYEDDFESSSSEFDTGDQLGISIARITRKKLLQRQQEAAREAEERRLAREKSRQELKEQAREVQEKEKQIRDESHTIIQQGSAVLNRTRSERNGLGISSNSKTRRRYSFKEFLSSEQNSESPQSCNLLSPEVAKSRTIPPSSNRTSRTRSKVFGPCRAVSSQSLPTRTPKKVPVISGSLSDKGNNDGTGPFSNPQYALKNALKTITSDDWQQKVDAMNDIERLAAHHPQDLQVELHSVVLALLPEVRNLRSSVSRMAINTLGELFRTFKRHMETDLDLITKTLLHKSGENVGFIREDIDNTMRHLVEGVSSQKAVLAIVAGGASHRNPAVRKTAAQLLSMAVEKLGSARCLTGCKEVAEKVLPATASFVMDCSPLARYYGRKIFFILMEHPDFESSLHKNVSGNTIRNISSVLDSIRKKGIGEMPKEGFSASSSKADLSKSRLLRSKN